MPDELIFQPTFDGSSEVESNAKSYPKDATVANVFVPPDVEKHIDDQNNAATSG